MKRGKRREARGEKKNMKKRITLWLLATLFLANVSLADAQQTGKIFRIGFLDPSTASGSAVLVDAFRQELTKLGWTEGKNITIEYRFAEQRSDRLPDLAADLVRLKVDLIVVASTPPALAANGRALADNAPEVMFSIASTRRCPTACAGARPPAHFALTFPMSRCRYPQKREANPNPVRASKSKKEQNNGYK